MSALTIFADNGASEPLWQSTDADAIREQLNAQGVRSNAGRPTASSVITQRRRRC